jgi:GATA-binding protein 2
LRPLALIAADASDDEEGSSACSFDGDAEGRPAGGPECSHCHTHKTSVWRRSKTGAKLCNACGVYARLRGRDRPLELRKNKIKPRCKHAKALK